MARVVALAAGAAAVWLAYHWLGDEERRIRRQLTKLQRLAARAPGESDLAALAQARRIAELFTDPFRVVVANEGISTSDRRQLIGTIHSYRSRSSTLVVEVSGEEIFLDAARTGANVFLVVRFLSGLGDLASADSYRVRLHLALTDGDWLIDEADVERVRG